VCEEIGCILPWFNFCSPINRGSQSCWFSVDSEAILKLILFWYQNRLRIETSELTPESMISILNPNENRLQLDTRLRSGPELKSELITESTRNSVPWLPLMITRKCQLGKLPCCSHPGVRNPITYWIRKVGTCNTLWGKVGESVWGTAGMVQVH
jgi:hypothetical protein